MSETGKVARVVARHVTRYPAARRSWLGVALAAAVLVALAVSLAWVVSDIAVMLI
jgi:hypothetical protein